MTTFFKSPHAYSLPCSAPRSKHHQSGAELVELSLTILYFFLLIFLIFEGIRFVYSYTVTSYQAYDGLRYAVIRGSEALQEDPNATRNDIPIDADKIRNYILGKKLLNLTIDNIQADVSGITPGSKIIVTVNYPFYSSISLLSGYFNATVSSKAEGIVIY